MAFPNSSFFSWNPQTEITDEEYKLFHSIDRELIKKLMHTLGYDSFNAISVVAFILLLERRMLASRAVEKIRDWPNHLVSMLADQVVALLEWLKNSTIVWDMRGDISLIQELCSPDVGFVYLHQRRLEILKQKGEIVNEMAEKAFKDMFPGGVVERSDEEGVGRGSGGDDAVSVPREIENKSFFSGVLDGSFFSGGGGSNVGGEFGAGGPVADNFESGSGGRPVYVPREVLVNRHQDGVQIESAGGFVHGPREVESNVGGEFADEVPVHGPQVLENNVGGERAAVGAPVFGFFGSGSGGRAVYVPREVLVNRHPDGVQIGSAGGLVHGPREVENNVGGEFAAEVPVHGQPVLESNVGGEHTVGAPVFGYFGSGSGGRAVYVPREVLVNRHHDGVQIGSAGELVHGPREVENNVGGEFAAGVPVHGLRELQSYNHDGAGFQVRGRYIRDPRELMNMNHNVVVYGSPAAGLLHGRFIHDTREMENQNIGVRIAAGPVRNPQELQNNIYNGVGYRPMPRLIYVPRHLNSVNQMGLGYAAASGLVQGHQEHVNMNGGGAGGFGPVGRIVQVHREPVNMLGGGAGIFGTIGGLVPVHREPENMNGDGSDDGYDDGYGDESILEDGQILPNVPFGPRMGYVETDGGNPGNSRRSEMMNTRRAFSEDELAMLLSGLNVQEEETDVHDDDKTIFLTFSRGYPITEPEIWGFFTRRFGNFVKVILFEEVAEGAQPLYARLVARNSSILPLICDVNIRTKYVINGKHVWAKKYVRKHHTPPPRLSPGIVDPPPSP